MALFTEPEQFAEAMQEAAQKTTQSDPEGATCFVTVRSLGDKPPDVVGLVFRFFWLCVGFERLVGGPGG